MARSSGTRVVTVNDVLDGHAVLDIQCLDRLYLSGFVQGLQMPGGVVFFLRQIRGMPIASPSLFEQIGTAVPVYPVGVEGPMNRDRGSTTFLHDSKPCG